MPRRNSRPTGLKRRGLPPVVGRAAAAMPVITPTEEFHEIVKVAASTRVLWDQSLTREDEEQRLVEIDRLEAPVREIEKRLASGPSDLNDLLTLAAIQ